MLNRKYAVKGNPLRRENAMSMQRISGRINGEYGNPVFAIG